MRLYKEFSEGYTPWSGAKETCQRIQDAGKWEMLEAVLDDIYPDGMTETELNDILWFEAETVFEWLGISDDDEEETGETEEPAEMTDPANHSAFDDFCQDCERCPFDEACKTQEECKKRFEELKGARHNERIYVLFPDRQDEHFRG